MNNKKVGSLLIFAIAIIGAIKFIQKPESKLEETRFKISKEADSTIISFSPEAPEPVKTSKVETVTGQKSQATNPEQKMKQKPLSRFLTQDSNETLASFKKEEILDAGWAYTQEQLIYNLLTQEVYANEGVKTADQVNVKCKTETCLITTKQESSTHLQALYQSLIKLGQDRGYEFVPVTTSPEEAIFAIYPPKP